MSLVQDLALKHLCYVVNAGGNVRAISNELEKISRLLEDIKSKIESDERDGRKATVVVQGWMEDADKCDAQVMKIQQDYDQRGYTIHGSQGLVCCS